MFENCKLTYFSCILLFVITGCNLSKNVPKGEYLLHSNKLNLNFSSKVTQENALNKIDLKTLIKENNVSKEELVLLINLCAGLDLVC